MYDWSLYIAKNESAILPGTWGCSFPRGKYYRMRIANESYEGS